MSMTWWNWCRSSPRALDPAGPGDDGAVAGPAPVRGDLLGPLVRGAHRVRPSDRVMVVGGGAADAVDVGDEELGCLHGGRAVEDEHLVEAAVDGALGAGTVVPDHQVDQGVVVDLEFVEGVEQAADVVIGVLEEPGVDLHLPLQDRLQLLGHVLVGGDLLMPGRELGVGRDHPELLLPRERLLTQHIPPGGEPTTVAIRPLLGNLVGRVGGPRRVVDEERLVGHEGLLLPHPADGLVGHVLGEVIALLRGRRRLDRRGPLVQARVVLVGLATDESVEVLEPASRRPAVERSHLARLPDRHLVALAELGRAVAVEQQRLGERRSIVGPHRAVARSRGRELGDGAHPDRVVVAAGQQRLPGGGAQGRGVEAGELQACRRKPVSVRCRARTAERARRPEADVVQQDDQHVRRTLRWTQLLDRRERRVRVPRVVRRQAGLRPPRNGENRTRARYWRRSHLDSLTPPPSS